MKSLEQSMITKSNTICTYCGVGCGIEVSINLHNTLSVKGIEDHPVNKGMLCSKGMHLNHVVQNQEERLLYPQMRSAKNHPLKRISWDTALERASAVFNTFIKKYGSYSVGFYVSGQCLTEEYYVINKLAKGYIGTNNIDTNSRLCMSSAVAAYTKSLGEDAVPIAYDDIEIADCFLIAGANPAWCHPILFRRIEKHKEENPAIKIIVIDPRITDTAVLADLHLQLTPGTDEVLLHAIGRILIENENVDLHFIEHNTEGFNDYKAKVFSKSIAESSAICDVAASDIKLAAQFIAQADGFLSLWTMGLNQSINGVNNNLALINLNLITGHIGKPGSGPFSLTGQPNAMGGREVGGMATLLPAHKKQDNPKHRQEVADFWGVDSLPTKPGLTATQMFEALDSGKLKAIWIVCTNPSVSMPNALFIDSALKKAKFVIVQDISSKSDTVSYADLVLPAAGWLEKEGTMTNSERRISYLPKVIDAPGEALPDVDIFIKFAQKMGYQGFEYKSNEEIYKEHCQSTKGTNIDISELTYQQLKRQGSVQWPIPDVNHLGTKRLFEDKKFYTKSGKAHILSGGERSPNDQLTKEFPLILTTGRIRDQWHTMTKTGSVNKLKKHHPKPFLEMNPVDASELNIENGNPVVICNKRGEVKVNALITDKIKKGVVFLPMHWGKILENSFGRANNITNDAYDPISKQPGFKFSAVNVKNNNRPTQKIVIVGAGAAAYRFINSYRELNKDDEIHVFSKEEHPFYNRVLLPEYVNNHKHWEDLLKFKYGEFDRLNITLHKSISIDSINKDTKTIIDSKGKLHSYDTLILGTGSRAFVPNNIPMSMPGLFTMRDRNSANKLKERLTDKGHILIVGGGLLGLELTSALREINIEVSIVQLSTRLMERQLDTVASNLLRQLMEEMGVTVYTNDEVLNLQNKSEKNISIGLKSGKNLECQGVVFAIGTRPNNELAKLAKLECGRGVIVNDYLQTSDSCIYAMGELAEHNQKLNGTTAAAEDQADIVARHLVGDLSTLYRGTVSMNILKFPKTDICSIGMVDSPVGQEGYDEIIVIDKSLKYYKKCIIYKDKLVGAILMGDKKEFVEFKDLIENQVELSEKRNELLRPGNTGEPLIGQLVCSCANVGTGNLESAFKEGKHKLKEVCKATGAGLGCGSCKGEVHQLLNKHLSKLEEELILT